jgi:hypothetical protein
MKKYKLLSILIGIFALLFTAYDIFEVVRFFPQPFTKNSIYILDAFFGWVPSLLPTVALNHALYFHGSLGDFVGSLLRPYTRYWSLGIFHFQSLYFPRLIVYVSSLVISYKRARLLRRPASSWLALAVLFPYVSPLVLGFSGENAAGSENTIRKWLRGISIAVGVIALAFPVRDLLLSTLHRPVGRILEYLLSYWPKTNSFSIQKIGCMLEGRCVYSFDPQFFLPVAAVILAVLLAGLLKRSRLDWGVIAFFCPFLSPAVVAILGARQKQGVGVISWIFTVALPEIFKGGSGGTRVSQTKRCSRCNRVVPNASRAGQRCPHCGAYWSNELTSGARR